MGDVTEYLKSMEDRIDSINTCEALQEAANSIEKELQELLSSITEQMNVLKGLMVSPGNIGEVITWINKMIAQFSGPYQAYILELTLTTVKIAEILAKLTAKIATLGCTFPPPSAPKG